MDARTWISRTFFAFALGFTTAGCERTNPTPPTYDASRPDAGARLDAANSENDGAVDPDGGSCTLDGGGACYACIPSTSAHVLNACTAKTCVPFPITRERLPLLRDDGTLPPL